MTQGTIFHSHTFSLFVKTREELEPEAIVAKLRENTAIAVAEGDETFSTTERSRPRRGTRRRGTA